MITRLLLILFIYNLFFYHSIYSQASVLLLQNPSFEDEPGFSRTPRGWFFCGEIGETPPDVHPFDDPFGVTHEPQHGFTYIGMVVRDNNTWEGLSQWLQQPIQAGQCYQFSIYAARSPYYQSVSRSTWRLTNYDRPVILRVWGGNLNCEKKELLAVSPLIESTEWQRYTFDFQPQASYNRLVIEAYYEPDAQPYCGNILIDGASPVVPVHCGGSIPIVAIDTLHEVPYPADIQAFIAELDQQIVFSEIDQQLEQHVFYLPTGALHQANKPLFILSQIPRLIPDRKLIFYLNEDNKRFFKEKSENLERELLLAGLQWRQFRIHKYRPSKSEREVGAVEVLVEVQ